MLLLERQDGILGTGGLAWQPHSPCLWQKALHIYAHLQKESGQPPLDHSGLKPNAYPWLATILMPGFFCAASRQERINADLTLSVLAFGLLEEIRKSLQRN